MDDNAKPFAIHAPRRIPIPLISKVKQQLDRLEASGIIRKITDPTDWCSPLVVVPKKNSDVRLCVDYTRLNQAVKRERHILPSVDHTLAQMQGALIFSKLDANSGFHQIKLTESSQLLTTFISPFGRYCYTRMPFGINSGPEHFQSQMHRVLEGLEGVTCLMDDMVVFGSTAQEHDTRLTAVLTRLAEANVTLNKEKCTFKSTSISFLGHKIVNGQLMADEAKTSAVAKMDAPTNVTELRRFMGMINQLAKFLPSLAQLTSPLRPLLSSKNEWIWGPAQTQAFTTLKALVCSPKVLTLYDPNRPTRITADSSSYGLGAVLQQFVNNKWCPIAYASRSLTETEQRYAMVEKETLALLWACNKFSDYIIGLPSLTLETDHKPLLALLGSKQLTDLPARIQRMRIRMMRYPYTIIHTAGKDLHTADTLSRAPVPDQSPADIQFASAIEQYVDCFHAYLPATDQRIEQVKAHQSADDTCKLLIKFV